MAYKNYNRNRNNRYNGGQGYNNDNKKFYYMDRPQEQQPTFNGFDATQYIKPEINIKDTVTDIYYPKISKDKEKIQVFNKKVDINKINMV